jgi:CRISPR/Cas system endoribonuclease Cas6 (RAMP superfamily)
MELEFDENDVEDWERFVVVKQGSGAKLSNQRALRTNKRIKSVVGRFTLTFSPDFVSPKKLREALEWGGQHVGIGASRKMGMGRFTVTGFEQS